MAQAETEADNNIHFFSNRTTDYALVEIYNDNPTPESEEQLAEALRIAISWSQSEEEQVPQEDETEQKAG